MTTATTSRRSTRSRRSSSPGSTPRSTSGSTTSAPRRPWRCAGQGRRRQRAARLPRVPGGLHRRAVASARQRGRTQPASALGVHGVKDPDLPDTMYVDDLVVADTVNTMPEKTLEAFADHGEVAGDQVTKNYDDAAAGHRRARGGRHRLRRRGRRARGTRASTSSRSRGTELLDTVRARWRRRSPHEPDSLEHRHRPGTAAAFELSFGYPDEAAFAAAVEQLIADSVASRIAAQDPTLWGPDAEAESAMRLGWVSCPRARDPLLAEIATLARRAAGRGARPGRALRHGRLLAGSRGDLPRAADVELDVLDSTTPTSSAPLWRTDLSATVVVVSSKSGGTVETDSQRRAFENAFGDAGSTPPSRIVVVTDPGSALEKLATEAGYRRLPRRPPWSAAGTAHSPRSGWCPTGLAGADIADLLDEAEAIRPALEADAADNPAPPCSAPAGLRTSRRRQASDRRRGLAIAGFADWAEQLVAESTGKDGKGILPVAVEGPDAPELRAQHARRGARRRYGPEFVFDRPSAESGWRHGRTHRSAPSSCCGSTPPRSPAG